MEYSFNNFFIGCISAINTNMNILLIKTIEYHTLEMVIHEIKSFEAAKK